MDRRDVIGLGALAAGTALIRPLAAWADRIRVLPNSDPTGSGPGDSGGALRGSGDADPVLRPFLASVQVGELRAHRGLGVLWLTASRPPARVAIETLDEARARGKLVIAERAQPTVPVLVADNRGATHVLLLAGEIMLGGKQNRVVAADVLLPPGSGPRDIAVFCVEQGRWAGPTTAFRGSASLAAPSLRSELAAQPSQDRVWAQVRRETARASAPSPTSNYQLVFDKPEVAAYQREMEHAIDAKVVRGAQGAAVFSGERLLGIDLFHDPELFPRAWPKILRAHALETYLTPVTAPPESRLRAVVAGVLLAAIKAPATRRATPGVGTLVEFRVERLRGSALVAEPQVVHAAML